MPQSSIQPGFREPVHEQQAVFRQAMNAMARPGQILAFRPGLISPPPLPAPSAALLLTLCDFETSVWLDPPLSDTTSVREFLRFHTGARIVPEPAEAAFAVISDAARMPAIATFAQGTPEYPDRSTTLIIGVRNLSPEGWRLEGPGIRDHIRFSAALLPGDFAGQVRANRALFPRGVDMFFTTPTEIAALPRSVSLMEIG